MPFKIIKFGSSKFVPFKTVYKWLEKHRIINQFKYLDNQILLALDGTEYYCSKKINCPHCNHRNHRNGETTYYHQVVTPVIVSPSKKEVINLAPEFIKKQDGKSKQDCENAAVKRWLFKNPVQKEKKQITLLGDDLYSRQPICELALKQGYNFIFVALPSSHKSLYEWIYFSEKNGEMIMGEIKKYEKGKRRIYRYRYVNNVPLRESEPSLMVNWYEVEIFDSAKNKVIYQNSFIPNHELNDEKIFKIIVSGRTRWKAVRGDGETSNNHRQMLATKHQTRKVSPIHPRVGDRRKGTRTVENESNNILKNQGYNLEHNFGHGEENLAEILLSLNLLAFLFHNVLDLVNGLYQKIREILVTRKTFFNDIRALLKYVWFQSWQDLFVFILTEGDEKK